MSGISAVLLKVPNSKSETFMARRRLFSAFIFPEKVSDFMDLMAKWDVLYLVAGTWANM
jgi:hypothetical protein